MGFILFLNTYFHIIASIAQALKTVAYGYFSFKFFETYQLYSISVEIQKRSVIQTSWKVFFSRPRKCISFLHKFYVIRKKKQTNK